MTHQELAQKLNGREYRNEMTPNEEREAKSHNLVVAFGASDDLLEFRGAVYDEVGAYDGGEAMICAEGLLEKPENDEDDYQTDKFDELFEKYLANKKSAIKVVAVWDTDGYSWVIKTPVEHSTFEIIEDGEKYCKGIVFNLPTP